MLNGFLKDNDHVQQRLAGMQVLEFSDYFALSLYPSEGVALAKPYQEIAFDELFSLSGKPMVVAEAGYGAETFSMSVGKNLSTLRPDPVNQQKFLDAVLQASEKWKVEFVIFFTVGDYRQLLAGYSPRPSPQLPWQKRGLFDENGNPLPALNSWGDWLRRKVVQ